MTPVFSTNNNTTTRKYRRRIGEFTQEIRSFKKSLDIDERIRLELQLLNL